jgi:hypothetical protein
VVIGVTYKAFDLAHDLGAAAISREDRWLGAELVLVDRDAQRLKEMKHNGVDLDGPEATELKRGIYERMRKLTASERSPAGYTASVIIKNLPYAISKVAIEVAGVRLRRRDQVDQTQPVPKAINWALTRGRLAAERSGLGEGARAGLKEAADKAMHDTEKKLVANRIATRQETRSEAIADALSGIYRRS